MPVLPHHESVVVPNKAFESTHWSVILEASQQDSPSGQAALAALCKTYWRPVFAFVRSSGHSMEDAEDLTQGFFERLVEKNWLQSVTREGGRFRSVLLKAVKHFLLNAHDHAQTLKRGGGRVPVSFDAEDHEARARIEPVENVTPDTLFEQQLALQTLEKVLERLRREYAKAEKAELFDELKVFLSGGARPVSHEEVAARHGISVSAVGVAVHRLRRRYGELLRQEVARTVNAPQDVDEELRHLIAVLGR